MQITLKEVILFLLKHQPGLSDRELTEAIYGSDTRHQQVNGECRYLADRGIIRRRTVDAAIRNFLSKFGQTGYPRPVLVAGFTA